MGWEVAGVVGGWSWWLVVGLHHFFYDNDIVFCFILIIILFIFCIICVKTPVGLTLSFIHAHTSASTMGKSSFCPTSFLSVSE